MPRRRHLHVPGNISTIFHFQYSFYVKCHQFYHCKFQFHIATHDNKKALLSIRKNGEEIASIFDQNHKDNHKNSMAGQNVIVDVKRGDEIVVYAYTGTWLADFPMNHYTHWVGLLLKPSQEEVSTN